MTHKTVKFCILGLLNGSPIKYSLSLPFIFMWRGILRDVNLYGSRLRASHHLQTSWPGLGVGSLPGEGMELSGLLVDSLRSQCDNRGLTRSSYICFFRTVFWGLLYDRNIGLLDEKMIYEISNTKGLGYSVCQFQLSRIPKSCYNMTKIM